MADQEAQSSSRRLAPVLWGLLAIFILRVISQMLVASGWNLGFLPPMKEWQSGLLPYSWLVVSQIVILTFYGKMCIDFSRGQGFWTEPRRGLGKGFLIFGYIYLGSMILRYILRMALHPEVRWFGGAIPIFLHCVLAVFLLLVGNYHWKHSSRPL